MADDKKVFRIVTHGEIFACIFGYQTSSEAPTLPRGVRVCMHEHLPVSLFLPAVPFCCELLFY
jgi:hypothetical protein